MHQQELVTWESEWEHHRHPVTGDLTNAMLIERVAQLWDQVWWLSLPWWRRWFYLWQGHRAPIRMYAMHSQFYGNFAFTPHRRTWVDRLTGARP